MCIHIYTVCYAMLTDYTYSQAGAPASKTAFLEMVGIGN